MPTRIVTDTVRDANGVPMPESPVTFTTMPRSELKPPPSPPQDATGPQYTENGSYPYHSATVITDGFGAYEVELVQGLQYRVAYEGGYTVIGSSTTYNGMHFTITVPFGDGPIPMAMIRAYPVTPPDDPTLADFAENHITDRGNPHDVTADQVGSYTKAETDSLIEGVQGEIPTELAQLDTDVTGAELDAMAGKVDGIETGATANATDDWLRNRVNHSGEQSIDTITGLQDALDAIPDNLAPVATSGSYTDLDDVPETFPPSPHTHDDRYVQPGQLGSAAAADASDFATAAQGALADTAVQTAAALTDAIDQRHEHANKALLDTVTPELLVPGGGLRGQVLTAGLVGNEWIERPLITPRANVWLTPESQGMGSSNLTASRMAVAGNIDMAPLYFPIAVTIHRMGIAVDIASDSGSCRLGLYDSGGNILVDAGVVSTATTGQKLINFPDVNISPGWIYAVLLPDQPFRWRGYLPLIYGGLSGLTSSFPGAGWARISSTYGPLPPTIDTTLTNTAEGPRIGVVIR